MLDQYNYNYFVLSNSGDHSSIQSTQKDWMVCQNSQSKMLRNNLSHIFLVYKWKFNNGRQPFLICVWNADQVIYETKEKQSWPPIKHKTEIIHI